MMFVDDQELVRGKIEAIDRLKGRISVFTRNGLVTSASYMGDLNELREGMTVLVGKVNGGKVILSKGNAIPRLSTSNTVRKLLSPSLFFKNISSIYTYSENLYVTENSVYGELSLIKFTDLGGLLLNFGEVGNDAGTVNIPYDLCVYNSEIYVACLDHRIVVFDNEGKFNRQWGSYGEGNNNYKYPSSICISDGLVYVGDGDNSTGFSRITVTDTLGNFVRRWSIPGYDFNYYTQISSLLLFNGELFCLCWRLGYSSVKVYDLHGNFLREFGDYETLEIPNAMALSAQGELFILSTNLPVVCVFTTLGNYIHRYIMGSTGYGCCILNNYFYTSTWSDEGCVIAVFSLEDFYCCRYIFSLRNL